MSIGVESRISAGRPLTIERDAWLWLVVAAVVVVLLALKGAGLLAPSPPAPLLPVAEWISAAMAWFTQQFRDFFRAISWLLGWPFGWIRRCCFGCPGPRSC